MIAMGDWSRGWARARGGGLHLKGMVPTMTMALIDAFRARGHVIGFIDESYSSKMCSRSGCAEGVCDDKWLVVPARPELEPPRRRRVVRAVVRCDLCRTIFERD